MSVNPGKIGPLIQAVHEVTSAPARFWDRGARWFVVRLYVLEQPGDELRRFFGGDSLPLGSKASLEYATPGKSCLEVPWWFGLMLRSLWGLIKMHETLWFCLVSL